MIYKRKELKLDIIRIKGKIAQSTNTEKIIFTLSFLAILIYSLSTPLIYDEGLYHLQSMQWAKEYRAIIGLGNLHGRLGFNSSFLLLSTLLDYLKGTNSFFTINSFALFIFTTWLITEIIKTKDVVQKLVLIFILLTSIFNLGTDLSSTSTDILPSILIIYLLIGIVLHKDAAHSNPLKIILIASVCVTLKLSSIPILLSLILLLFFLYREKKKRTSIYIIIVGLIIAIPWLIRFIILTGYLIYPLPSIDFFSVDWKIPVEMVSIEKDLAYAWARIPDINTENVLNMPFSEWFPIWMKNLSLYKASLYILAFLSSAIFFIKQSRSEQRDILLWIISIIGVLFSLLTAPDFRFSFGFIIASIAIPFLSIKTNLRDNIQYILYSALQSFAIIVLLWLTYTASRQVLTYQKYSTESKISLIYKPQSISILKEREKRTFDTHKLGNTFIFVPKESNQCFDEIIPCSPHISTNLELRGEGLQDGFRIKK